MSKYRVPLFATLTAASLSLAIWLYLALARGAFYKLHPFDDDASTHPAPNIFPTVIAIVPARNEAATIAETVTSLLQQSYAGEFSIIVVDDHSEDETASKARQAAIQLHAQAKLIIRRSSPLPQNWTGKLWALNEGLSSACSSLQASDSASTYYWFTDADILHAPDTLSRLISRAERGHLELTSLMVLLQAKSFPERLLIPPFLFFFLKLYPPRWTANSNDPTAGAAGGCILLRRDALEKIGGLSVIRSEIIDDCALARAIKRSGGKIWMGLTRASVSLRAYNSFAEICDMIARTAFTQLRHSSLLLLATLAAMFFTYLAPVALLFAPRPATRIVVACTWLLMSLLYLPTVRFYRLSPLWAPFLPFAAVLYTYATFLSAVRHYRGHGAEWKGRTHG